MQFEQAYFSSRKYLLKEGLVKCHVLEVVKWASKVSGTDLFRGHGKKALDVGCACGYAAEVLESLGYETYGVDLSKWGVRQAKTHSGGHFLVCDAQTRLPFMDDTFDLILCCDVLEHLEFPERAIQDMFEICDDMMVCTTPNKAVEKPVRKLMRDFDETHINVKFPSEWEKCIREKADCTFLRVETFYDLAAKFSNGNLFFRSFSVPSFGLTARILARK